MPFKFLAVLATQFVLLGSWTNGSGRHTVTRVRFTKLTCEANRSSDVTKSPISEQMVNAAQQAWCDAMVYIGSVDTEGGDVRAAASALVDALYDYAEGTVFFKPTMAFGKNTFRSTRRGAISYFVGGDPDFPEDTGFALKRWVKVWYDNNAAENGIQVHGDIAITMGNVYLQNAAGDEVMVDKTFVFRLCGDGKLRLCVHKSALPYSPDR